MITFIFIIIATYLIIYGIRKFVEDKKGKYSTFIMIIGGFFIYLGIMILIIDAQNSDPSSFWENYVHMALLLSFSLGLLIILAVFSKLPSLRGLSTAIIGVSILVSTVLVIYWRPDIEGEIINRFLITPTDMFLVGLACFLGWAIYILLSKITLSTSGQKPDPSLNKDEPPAGLYAKCKFLIEANGRIFIYSFLLLILVIKLEPYIDQLLNRTTLLRTPFFEAEMCIERKMEFSKIDPSSMQNPESMTPKYNWIKQPLEDALLLCEAHINLDKNVKGHQLVMFKFDKEKWEYRKNELKSIQKFIEIVGAEYRIDKWEELKRNKIDQEIIKNEVRVFTVKLRRLVEGDQSDQISLPDIDFFYKYEMLLCFKYYKVDVQSIYNSELYPVILSLLDNYTGNVYSAIDRLEDRLRDEKRWSFYVGLDYFNLSMFYMYNKQFILINIANQKSCAYSEKHLIELEKLIREIDFFVEYYKDSDKFDLHEKLTKLRRNMARLILFTKAKLSLLYAEMRIKEGPARNYVDLLTEQIKTEKNNFFFLDAIGWVKFKFSRTDKEKREAFLILQRAKYLIENSKDKFLTRNILPIIDSHFREVESELDTEID